MIRPFCGVGLPGLRELASNTLSNLPVVSGLNSHTSSIGMRKMAGESHKSSPRITSRTYPTCVQTQCPYPHLIYQPTSLLIHPTITLISTTITGYNEEDWPPKDPSIANQNHSFKLPDNPWTYENGNFNPSLLPSSSGRRLSTSTATHRKSARSKGPVASVPPYHPDYRPPGEDDGDVFEASSAGDDDDDDIPLSERRLVRRGSEGYEVHTIDREEMLRQHVMDHMEEPGRYNVYVPDPPSESDQELELESLEQEDVPLTARVESWRAAQVATAAN